MTKLEKLHADHPSNPNNPDVANVFFRAGMIKFWGRGIFKIINLCTVAGLPEPIFNIGFGWLQIEFTAKQNITHEIVPALDVLQDNYG